MVFKIAPFAIIFNPTFITITIKTHANGQKRAERHIMKINTKSQFIHNNGFVSRISFFNFHQDDKKKSSTSWKCWLIVKNSPHKQKKKKNDSNQVNVVKKKKQFQSRSVVCTVYTEWWMLRQHAKVTFQPYISIKLQCRFCSKFVVFWFGSVFSTFISSILFCAFRRIEWKKIRNRWGLDK